MRYGIELEYWTTDREGRLVSAGDVADRLDFVDREAVECLLEVKTSPCRSPDALGDELADRLTRVLEAARDDGKRLVPLGTPLGPASPDFRSSPRIALQRRVFGDDFRYAACAGAHLHVESVSPTQQLNALTALDPAVALVTTAAHFDGFPVGACARPLVYRRRLFRAAPELGRLWTYVEDADEWRRRSEERYRTFRSMAERRGADPATVESTFEPATTVWSPVRLRDDLGTVEWRAPDAGLPSRILRLVGDVDRLVFRPLSRGRLEVVTPPGGDSDPVDVEPGLDRDGERLVLPPFDRLREVVDDALASGTRSKRVRRYLRGMGLDPGEYDAAPPARRGSVDEAAARRIRLRRADGLERDVERLARGAERPDERPPPASPVAEPTV